MTDKQILRNIEDFAKDIIKSNLRMGLKINNELWIELFIENIENEFRGVLQTRLDLQLEAAEIISGLLIPHLKQ